MSYSTKSYVGDGVTTQFAITFEYYLNSEVVVLVNNIAKSEISDYSIGSGFVTFVSPPAANSVVFVCRITNGATREVIWVQGGSGLQIKDLNLAIQQLFQLIQELSDRLDSAITGGLIPTPTPIITNATDVLKRLVLFLSNHTTIDYP